MFKGKFGRPLAALAVLGFATAVPVVPAMADPTPAECVQYSIAVCGHNWNGGPWEALGYSSLQACRLQEYDNCMNGVPPYDPISFKPGAPAITVPTNVARRVGHIA